MISTFPLTLLSNISLKKLLLVVLFPRSTLLFLYIVLVQKIKYGIALVISIYVLPLVKIPRRVQLIFTPTVVYPDITYRVIETRQVS